MDVTGSAELPELAGAVSQDEVAVRVRGGHAREGGRVVLRVERVRPLLRLLPVPVVPLAAPEEEPRLGPDPTRLLERKVHTARAAAPVPDVRHDGGEVEPV